ncbi:RHS repeat-associated protein [Variovorax paradoxus]|uniref:RHS repeat domain-containing protein n=1 Tax=Variovorax atrisoli TaxID=3394203 RepID=UPI00119B4EFA|nr:RHS repeat-associated protein [Variovorax paradoxus]
MRHIHEPNSFAPLVQLRRASAMALSETTGANALMEANGGVYDIEQDPLWNGDGDGGGEQRQVPRAFDSKEMAFYQCDHLSTPQELTGSIAWSAQYKAWGEAREAISEAGRRAGFRNPIRFQGQYWDEETGLHYNRYRYYDPQAGRFISSDPIGLIGGINLHQYAPNSTEWLDPLGLARGQSTTDGAGRKPKTGKPNIDKRCPSCKKWEINRFNKVCEGFVPGVGIAKYFRDPKDGSWYSIDQTGHGGSAFKQFDQKGNILNHAYDLDEYGVRMGKHKGEAGKMIDLKSLKCKDAAS